MILALSYIILLVSVLPAVVGTVHMLQQNSYFNLRYLDWFKTASKFGFVLRLICGIVAGVLIYFNWLSDIPLLIFSAVLLIINLLIAVFSQKKAIKPLVFTKRVIRLFVTTAIILAICGVVFFLWGNCIFNCVSAFFLVGLSPLLIMAVNIINRPVEILVGKYFIADAKKMLRSCKNLKVIGVTGSYGKTGTKFILGRILSEKYNVLVTPESFNTPMGITRTVRGSLSGSHEIFVCEMGAKKVKEIKELCDIVHPDMGIITSVGPQHLDTFKTIENIANTKFELYDAVKEKGGVTFLNYDCDLIKNQKKTDSFRSFGSNSDNDYRAENIQYSREGSVFDFCFGDERITLSTKLLGSYNVTNILGACSIAIELGVSPSQIKYAVASLKPATHRLEMKPFFNGGILIDDAYNANPVGCIEAVNVLSRFEGMKKVIITPGLVELGDKEYEYNKALGKAAGEKLDEIYLIGKNRSIPLADGVRETDFDQSHLHICDSFKEALAQVQSFADSNTVVLFENDLPDNYLY